MWAINPADEVYVRVNLTKSDPKGKEWTKIDGSMKTISVGPTGVLWAVDKKDTIWRRLGAKSSNPIGSKWQSVTGRLSHISVGQAGVWGISPKNEVAVKPFLSLLCLKLALDWLKLVAALNIKHLNLNLPTICNKSINLVKMVKLQVMFRDGTYGLPGDADGSGWTKVDGMMVWLSSGENIVWAVSANGTLWYRAGIEQGCPMGTNWFKVNTANDK